ncbi:hypothetical protein R6Q57_015681 [Mikania cordata]
MKVVVDGGDGRWWVTMMVVSPDFGGGCGCDGSGGQWCWIVGGYVKWKKKPATKGQHGGMLAASFVLVVEVMESLAFLACGCNLVVYLLHYMQYSPSEAANNDTNFMGTAFLLALLVGFLSDAFFITYKMYLIVQLLQRGILLVLRVQV